MAGVIGIGAIFFGVSDVEASARWYREVLGLDLENWGGVKFGRPKQGCEVFSLFPAGSPYFESSRPLRWAPAAETRRSR
ncbi:MAG: VOC family protein [Caulobacteraceae bacterium]